MPKRLNKSLQPTTFDKGQWIQRGVFFSETPQELILFCTGEFVVPTSPIPVGTVCYIDDGTVSFPLKSYQPLVYPIKRKVRVVVPKTVWHTGGGGNVQYVVNAALKFHVASDIDNFNTDFTRFITEVEVEINSDCQITEFDNIGFPYYMTIKNPVNDNNYVQLMKSNAGFMQTYLDYVKQDNLNNAYASYPNNGGVLHSILPANCGATVFQILSTGSIGAIKIFICFREQEEPLEEIKDLIYAGSHVVTHDPQNDDVNLAVIDMRKYDHASIAITQVAGGTLAGTWFLDEYNEIIPCHRSALHIDNGTIPAAGNCEVDVGSCFMRYALMRIHTTGGAGTLKIYIDGCRP